MSTTPGDAYPLGATWDEKVAGTNFALFSEVAKGVDLCLFDPAGNETRIALTEVDSFVWHGKVPGVRPGQHYGYRVHGPWDPVEGKVCNPHKLLLDPYAKAVHGTISWDESVFGYKLGFSALRPSTMDGAPRVMRSVVVDPVFDWGVAGARRSPTLNSVIYEVHVRGLTRRHPEIPSELRGTYQGLARPGRHRLPAAPRCHRGRADAGAPVRTRPPGDGKQLAAAMTPSATSPRTTTIPPPLNGTDR